MHPRGPSLCTHYHTANALDSFTEELTLHPCTHSQRRICEMCLRKKCWFGVVLISGWFCCFWQVWSSSCQGQDFIATCVVCFTPMNKQPRRHTVGVQFTTGTYRSETCSLPFSFHPNTKGSLFLNIFCVKLYDNTTP